MIRTGQVLLALASPGVIPTLWQLMLAIRTSDRRRIHFPIAGVTTAAYATPS